MSAELKLATQQEAFSAHFRHQEEGSRQISRMVSLEGAGEEVEELKLSEEEDSRTVRIN